MDSNALKVVYLMYGQTPVVNERGNIVNMLRVSIKVGQYGPFTKDFDAGQDDPATVKTWIAQQQSNVQAVCGCS